MAAFGPDVAVTNARRTRSMTTYVEEPVAVGVPAAIASTSRRRGSITSRMPRVRRRMSGGLGGGGAGMDDLDLRAAAQWAQRLGDGKTERGIDGALEVREARGA
jgi:hypothetical protein